MSQNYIILHICSAAFSKIAAILSQKITPPPPQTKSWLRHWLEKKPETKKK
ncbi:MAG: hypothetical protein GY820_37080 [Gammaproteobacteria bacterium]|nr:hypothetical protein [Gammaproteobacteria bacterium]